MTLDQFIEALISIKMQGCVRGENVCVCLFRDEC